MNVGQAITAALDAQREHDLNRLADEGVGTWLLDWPTLFVRAIENRMRKRWWKQ